MAPPPFGQNPQFVPSSPSFDSFEGRSTDCLNFVIASESPSIMTRAAAIAGASIDIERSASPAGKIPE
ncbi:MAG: hypothetical protein OXH76_02875 [Boseongicola sp.]|nr:hypothetical protein [Boseongicola sp.]